MQYSTAKTSVSKSSATGTTSASHAERSSTASRNCKKRDKQRCILTGLAYPDAAHIYPHCLKATTREPRAVGRFWDILNLFWDEDRVKKWKEDIFGNTEHLQDAKDGCFNLLSLDKYAHSLWGKGRYALRPLAGSDSKTLKVQLFWQRSSSDGLAEIDLLTEPKSSRGLYGDRDNSLPVRTGACKSNGEPEYRAIASGDIFTIETHDPEHLPLPSWPLLEMQWYLQRIAGMSGAAEIEDLVDYHDDDAPNTAPCNDAIRRTREIYNWLRILPETEEEIEPRQSPVQVYHLTTL
ncbi:hypothetical protein BJX70DRAFT_95472 [Aspergillus crustosus]